jgi:hypothetical protein
VEQEEKTKFLHKKTSHKLQQVAEDYRPGFRLKEGTPISIHLSIQQRNENREASQINEDSYPLTVLMLFLTENF